MESIPRWLWHSAQPLVQCKTDSFGGKAVNLARLHHQGIPIPSFVCLGAEWKDLFFESEHDTIEQRADVIKWVVEYLDAEYYSVRSSGLEEDSKRASFAGQLDSFLFVPKEQLSDRIKDCFNSASKHSAEFYRQQQSTRGEGECLSPLSSGVVVQIMINSQKSGVAFTANPLSMNRNEMVITGCYGVGEGSVADLVATDTFYVQKDNLRLTASEIKTKATQIVLNSKRLFGTELTEVANNLQEEPVLTQHEWQELVNTAIAIEQFYGEPQDIEWAWDQSGKLHILQSRPITTLPQGSMRIFDNSNLVEGYPGVTLPLTFSFIRIAYCVIFKNLMLAMGAKKHLVEREQASISNMVGYLNGRLYYNLTNWYQFYTVVPGLAKYIPNWEQAVGIPARDLSHLQPKTSWGKLKQLSESVNLFVHLFYQGVTLPSKLKKLNRLYEELSHEIQHYDLSKLNLDELVAIYENTSARFFPSWHVTLLNDFFLFKLVAMLTGMTEKLGIAHAQNAVDDLLTDQADMESIAPIRAIHGLLQHIQQNKALLSLFKEHNTSEIHLRIQSHPQFIEFNTLLGRYLSQYGDRTTQELKLEVPGFSEQPEQFLELIKFYLVKDIDFASINESKKATHQRAESLLRERLKQKPFVRTLFNALLSLTRQAMTARENLRFTRTRTFGLVRRVALVMGDALSKTGAIAKADDIFYLSVEEVMGYIKGAAIDRDLANKIAQRKGDFEQFNQQSLPSRIITHGPVGSHQLERFVTKTNIQIQEEDNDPMLLHGMGCGGQNEVTAKALLVTDPSQYPLDSNQEDFILVAESTDPGWIFLMVAAKAVIVERGNLLSHSAIVARELGIPTIISVSGATQKIKQGQWLTVNPTQGTVQLLSSDEAVARQTAAI